MTDGKKRESHLYYIAKPEDADGMRWVKIGRSGNVAQRIKSLRTLSESSLEILGIEVGRGDHEQVVHKRFESLRGNGEWFLFSRKDCELLRERVDAEFPHWADVVDSPRCRPKRRSRGTDSRQKVSHVARWRAWIARMSGGPNRLDTFFSANEASVRLGLPRAEIDRSIAVGELCTVQFNARLHRIPLEGPFGLRCYARKLRQSAKKEAA